MTQLFLTLFGAFTRIVFEWGVIVLAGLLWGWHVGVAFLLWYVLWTWMSLYIIRAAQSQLTTEEFEQRNKDFTKVIEKMNELAEKAKEKDKE